MFKISKRF